MNSTRHDSKKTPSGCCCAPVWICALFSILLSLSGIFYSFSPAARESQGQTLPVCFDTAHHVVQGLPCNPSAPFPRLATPPAPMAIMAQALFSLPADTETTDTETAMANLANPVLLIFACITWASWHPTAALHVSIPLYLSHQALLC